MRVAVEHGEQQVDRVDVVVAEHLGLAICVHQELAQRNRLYFRAVGSHLCEQGRRVDAGRADGFISQRSAARQRRAQHVDGRRCGSAFSCRLGGAFEDLARRTGERNVSAGAVELQCRIRHWPSSAS